MAVYDVGDRVRLLATFKNAAGVATDPTTITVKTKTPAGVVATFVFGIDAQVVKDSTGNYHFDFDLTASGHWYYRWAATGAVFAAEEGTLDVRVSRFP